MKKNLIILFLVSLFLGCSDEVKQFKAKEKFAFTPSIVNLSNLLTDEENYISFPNWFNDSIISAHQIEKIVRKSFLRLEELENENLKTKIFVPREIKEFSFTETGVISKLIIRNFYDEKEIGSHFYSFGKNKDQNGYCKTNLQHLLYAGIEEEEEDEFFVENLTSNQYKVYDKVEENSLIISYQNVETGDYLYYVIAKKYWGALSVDSLVSPTPKDEVVLGNQRHHFKKYQVTNKINESNVRLYQYDKIYPDKLLNWELQNYPFKQKRDFIYSNNGICFAYIDSIFSNEEFVTKTRSKIYYNKRKEPVRITHLKQNEIGDTLFISKDVFEYIKKEK